MFAEAIAKWRQREAALLILVEHAGRGQRSQQAVGGGRIGLRRGGKVGSHPPAVADQVGVAEDCEGVQRLGEHEAVDHTQQSLPGGACPVRHSTEILDGAIFL